MPPSLTSYGEWFFASGPKRPGRLIPRWIFLRALGLIFFSAFYSLFFQVRGLIGPDGLLPANVYLQAVKQFAGTSRLWYAPTLFWVSSSSRSLILVCCVGMIASILLVLNVCPRMMTMICMVAYLSFIATLQAFSSYQSDGMLLGAGFLCLFFPPPGCRPEWGEQYPPSRANLFLLQWLWFTIYFESGVAKIAGGDPEWRHLTAMDEYYQNGPLPTWIAWYAQHLPHWFHVGTAGLTLILELFLVWMLFLPRPFRIVLFWIVTPWQIGIILTSNYAFLNYLVLALGILLVDDEYLARFLPRRLRPPATTMKGLEVESAPALTRQPILGKGWWNALRPGGLVRVWIAGLCLTWIFYATAAQLLMSVFPSIPLPDAPVTALAPFRIAERYGLFAVMTRGRFEIEFQGSNDGKDWTAYPFRYKPQDPRQAPGIFAPYQPRFDWNLWFASLDNWRQNDFVLYAEEHLLANDSSVLALFRSNPFPNGPPRQIRAVVWQYWFTDWPEKRHGLWWRRKLIGLYAPQLEHGDDGKISVTAMPDPTAMIPQ